MQVGTQNSIMKEIELAMDSLHKSVALGIPADTIIFLDAHSCASINCL
jgi:hypothetical protein